MSSQADEGLELSRLEDLQAARTLSDLARLLNYRPSHLSYLLYKLSPQDRYRSFDIPKSSGGFRTIQAPIQRLKWVQNRLAHLLSDCLDSIEAEKPDRRKVSHGFQRRRSIVTNARMHTDRRYVLNLDLEDFFGTINFGRVLGFFTKDRNFELDPKVATVVAQIACHENALPQGAPSSPVISNLIGHILDARLIRLARDYGCTYTRYADDLTFSTNRKSFPCQLAYASESSPNGWVIGEELGDAVEDSGFSINPSKTRMQIQGSRQEATGLIVNEKVNIRQEYFRSVRNVCHSLFQTGEYYVKSAVDGGESGEPERTNKLAPLEGRLAHIYYVKVRCNRHQENNRSAPPEAPRELYRRFLFFKYFVASDFPVLVTEGKADIVYLKTAMEARREDYPELAPLDDSQVRLSVRFLNPSKVNRKLLNLGSSYSGMKAFINTYEVELKKYKFCPLPHPVILVVDNDSGGKKVMEATNNKTSEQDIKPDSAGTFFHIRDNLYLVKTLLGENGKSSEIEDCFPDSVRKQLNPEHKIIFANQVVRPGRNSIDFSGFSHILDGISQAIEDYRRKTNLQPRG